MPDENENEQNPPEQERPAKSGRSRRKRKSGGGRTAQYWMVVSSPDNFRKTREHGFSIQGLKSRHRRRVLADGNRMHAAMMKKHPRGRRHHAKE